MTRPRTIVIYTRQNCGLCRQAEALVTDLAPRSADVRLVDVDDDDDLLRRFHLRVPVIEVDGVEVAAAPVDEDAVRLAMRGRGGRWFGRGRRHS